eukprot:492944_1
MCCSHGFKAEVHDILTSKKWWANWIGFILAIAAGILSLYYDEEVITLNKWTTNPYDVYTKDLNIGISVLFFTIFTPILICEMVTNAHDPNHQLNEFDLWNQIMNHFMGYTIFYLLVLISFFVDAQQTLYNIGIGYSIISIILGIFFTNICACLNIQCWEKLTKTATKNCEFYIKIGLVLLATDLQIIFATGAPGLIVSWALPPVVLMLMFYFGTRKLNITNYSFVMALSSGTSICGVSAIAAVASVIDLPEQDSAIAMSILTFFTMFYMVFCPYMCMLFEIPSTICGAWIGGSVDETGKVVASVAILDDIDAYEAAVLVKMSQNMLIGVVCLFLAVAWADIKNHEMERWNEKQNQKALLEDDDSVDMPGSLGDEHHFEANQSSYGYRGTGDSLPSNTGTRKALPRPQSLDDIDSIEDNEMNKCEYLWKKFPKFILGYLILSVVISTVINPYTSPTFASNFQSNIKRLSIWLFTLGFVGIGANTKFNTLWQSVKDGKYLALYLVGQTFDTLITLGVAWLVFKYVA